MSDPKQSDMERAWIRWYNYFCNRSYTLAMYSGLAEAAFFAGWESAKKTLKEVECQK